MSSRRDFLVNVSRAVGAAAVLVVPAGVVAEAAEAARGGGPRRPATSGDMEKWLLSTGHGTLDPQIARMVDRHLVR